jgi:hypothetical protein
MRRKNSPLRKSIDACGLVWWVQGLDEEMKRVLTIKDQSFDNAKKIKN